MGLVWTETHGRGGPTCATRRPRRPAQVDPDLRHPLDVPMRSADSGPGYGSRRPRSRRRSMASLRDDAPTFW